MSGGSRVVLKRILARAGVAVTKTSTLDLLAARSRLATILGLICASPPNLRLQLLEQVENSKSQLGQDLFVLSQTDFRNGGFFVEFGATDGVELSNTNLLEKFFGWTGILAEPARVWQERLRANRQAAIDFRCVWSSTGEVLKFKESVHAEVSTVEGCGTGDRHSRKRTGGHVYEVETVSLEQLLDDHSAPSVIDYLSIDTEGSELAILSAFDFSRYSFRIISVEHNYTDSRQRIFDLLTREGYVRVLEEISEFDDWYVKEVR